MRPLLNQIFLFLMALATALGLVASAQSPTQPSVDLSIGPVAVNAQAVNVALALSVEFPTVGAAYRGGTYNHATEYLGYWDPKGCYDYMDTAPLAPLGGEYFYRTGTVDADRYCNTGSSGVGYSGNALNYVATSSIDLLRYALTGGDRAADTNTFTILGRAYLRSGWLHSGNFPTKRIPAALEGKVTPDYPDSSTADVLAGSCDNRVVFGRNNTVTNCNNPGTSGNLNKTRTVSFTTATVSVTSGSPAPAGGVFVRTYSVWNLTSPSTTATTISTVDLLAGHPVNTITYPKLTGNTVTFAPSDTTFYGPASDYFIRTDTVALTGAGSTTTTTPSIAPMVNVGVQTSTMATRFYQSALPASPYYRSFTILPTEAADRACRASTAADASLRGPLNGSGAKQSVGTGVCGSGIYTGFSNRLQFNQPSAVSLPLIVYEPYDSRAIWQRYTRVPVYKEATVGTYYYSYTSTLMDEYVVVTNVVAAPGPMFARVQVCNGSEATSRTDLCLRYPDGNYKPVGEIQRRNESMRLSAFGYAMDDTRQRYGGVLRAPMRYTGPTFRNSSGVLVGNPAPEWNANNGIFVADPLNATVFGRSGVINYLNKFGSTGVYKTFDPVGELYYEALRYFQGLPPTAAATQSLTFAMYDNFPIYSTTAEGTGTYAGWVDPVQNSCERRNFILSIGDVNTHNDRQLPGHGVSTGSVGTTTEDPARAVEPLLGDASKTFSAIDWTAVVSGLETNANPGVTYVDALGRTQNTYTPGRGTIGVNAGNNNLQGRSTGATNAGFAFAGAAYWANTQPIRLDTKAGKSMKDVRVKTFMIDVDEGGNGSLNVGRSFYLAGKYGWYNDANLDGNPFKTDGDKFNNKEWEDETTPGLPDGYVIASQAKRMIDGIKKFFAAATSEKGAVSVSSLSSQRYTTRSPNGDLFAPRFDTRDWSGTVQRSRLSLNTTTQVIESAAGAIWDAGALLTQGSVASTTETVGSGVVRTSERKIFTSNAQSDGSGFDAFEFKVSEMAKFDPAVISSLNTNLSSSIVDNFATERIGYLRGERSNEKNTSGGLFRPRNSIMGDIINSGPIFKQEADPTVIGEGYAAFASSVRSRTATIYVGTNGGMLHGLRASDGRELFAYVPHAVSKNLGHLTVPGYVHRPYVDAVPNIREAKIGGSWKTVLASGMGGGAQGVFALDVTSPDSFSGSNVLFEFTDRNDSAVGNVVTQPKIMKFRVAGTNTSKWYVVFGSGYNNYVADGNQNTTNKQSLFILSLDKQRGDPWVKDTNYFRIDLATSDTTKVDGLSNPGVYESGVGEAMYLYAGDLQGRLWRFNFSNGLSASTANTAVFGGTTPKPLFKAISALGAPQPITVAPLITEGLNFGLNVMFGTGKFVESIDADTGAQQAMYGVWDPLSNASAVFDIGADKLYARTLSEGTASATLSGLSSFTYGISASGTYRGWYFNFTQARERIAVEGALGLGLVAFNSTIPQGECSGDGCGREYALNPYTGLNFNTINTKCDAGLLSRPNIVEVSFLNKPIGDESEYAEAGTEITSKRTSTGRRKFTFTQYLLSTGTKLSDAGNALVSGTSGDASKVTLTVDGGRLSWREIRNFND